MVKQPKKAANLATLAAQWEKETGLSLAEWIERDLANRKPPPRSRKKG